MAVVLETHDDQLAEEIVADRLQEGWPDFIDLIPAPEMSLIDYFVSNRSGNRITLGLEIRTRKQTDTEVMQYGGLMLKQRKLLEIQQLSRALNMPIYFVFAFDNGNGNIWMANASSIPSDLPAHEPPRRRKYRDVACDTDPVLFLEWNTHVHPVAV